MSEAEVEKRVREVVVARFYSLAKVNVTLRYVTLCYVTLSSYLVTSAFLPVQVLTLWKVEI